MSILTRQGRSAIAEAIKNQPLHLAWGTGDNAWTSTFPPEDANATALMHELGRRTVTAAQFVTPDAGGDIEIVGAGKFSVSTQPTNNLLVTTRFEFADEADKEIREIGLFVGTTTNPSLPSGQRYFTPSQLVSPGKLLQLEHRQVIYRTAGTREVFQMLIIF